MTLTDAFARFILDEVQLKGGAEKTAKNYKTVLNNLITSIADVPISLLTYEHIIRWKTIMYQQGMQNSTISANLSKLRTVLKYCHKHNVSVLDYRDIELPKVIVKEPDYLDHSEVDQMIKYAERPRDKALLATLWSSGGRISEVLAIDRGMIENNQAVVLGKNSKYVTLYIDTHAQKYIDDYLESRSDRIPAIFTSAQRRRLTVQRAEQIVAQISAEAGITKLVTPHTFRHSFASDLLLNGADIRTVKDLLHHSNITTTMRYLHTKDSLKSENYQKFHSV